MPEQSTPAAGLISQQLFDLYSASWAEVINRPDADVLDASFRQDERLITGLGFSATQIAQLVATVGAAHIKVRFILQPPAPGAQAKFSLALFATDSLDARISSYYVPEAVYTDASAFVYPSQPGRPTIHKNQLHYVLAERWRQSWADVAKAKVQPEYFDSHYGPLRGYTYELGEFTALFLLLEMLDEAMLQVHFVLRDYYRPDPATSGDELAHTFALALRLKRQDEAAYDARDGDDPILDNGMPCPPNC